VVGIAVIALCSGASVARADVVYTFETPNFTLNQTTPILNVAPNTNPGSFLASFTDTVNANGYVIFNGQSNGLMVGQSIIAPTVTDALMLTFNTPVNQLTVDFAVNLASTQAAGSLRLTTSSGGNTSQASSVVGGGQNFQGGTLTFSTATPFTSATLQGFDSTGAPIQINLDNLHLNPAGVAAVPEPSALTLLAVGGIGLAAWRRWRTAATA
jgi:hypothetical protein